MNTADLIRKLEGALSALTPQAVEKQMQDFFAPQHLPGMEKKIRIGLHKLLDILILLW